MFHLSGLSAIFLFAIYLIINIINGRPLPTTTDTISSNSSAMTGNITHEIKNKNSSSSNASYIAGSFMTSANKSRIFFLPNTNLTGNQSPVGFPEANQSKMDSGTSTYFWLIMGILWVLILIIMFYYAVTGADFPDISGLRGAYAAKIGRDVEAALKKERSNAAEKVERKKNVERHIGFDHNCLEDEKPLTQNDP